MTRAIDIELNSSAVAKTEDGTILTSFSSDEPALAIQSLSASVSTLLQASYARIAVLEMIAASTATGTATTAVTDSVASLSLADEVTHTDVVVRAWSLISM